MGMDVSTATVEPAPKRTVVQVKEMDERLWREARSVAVREGLTMREFVERALRESLKKPRR